MCERDKRIANTLLLALGYLGKVFERSRQYANLIFHF